MPDNKTTITDLKQQIDKFIIERKWDQFHSPKSMSMHIATETAELMELFLWSNTNESWKRLEEKRQDVEDEVADIAYSLFNFCTRTNIDLSNAIQNKMKHNAEKYPIEKARGNNLKYTEL